MKKFFKNLTKWAFTMYAVCCKNEATGNQFKLRAILVSHNEWITLLNLVKAERQKQLDQINGKKEFDQEDEQVYSYYQHLKGILSRIEDAFKPL
jgi:hypothetical protein